MARTRVCPANEIGSSGAGGDGGVVMAGPVVLVWHRSGWPIDLTRRVMLGGRKMADMHGVGPGPAGGGMAKGQPATMNGGEDIGTGAPMTLTRGLGAVGLACPPWAQVTTTCMLTRNPGIR
jgi:hypothetical protein